MSTLTLALIQTELSWEDPIANRAHFDARIADIDGADIIVLPEMFSTGFSMNSRKLAENMDGPTVGWLRETAAATRSSLCGSVIIGDGDHCYNRFLFVSPAGDITSYDKRHLFRMGTENENYTAGNDRPVIEAGDFRLFPQVCYDLRFPVFSRNDMGFDVIVYVANWPAARRAHWQTLLRARAIENLCYVVGLNRIGTDGNDVAYAGDSAVIDFRGETVASLSNEDRIIQVTIDKEALLAYRLEFPAWRDADAFNLADP